MSSIVAGGDVSQSRAATMPITVSHHGGEMSAVLGPTVRGMTPSPLERVPATTVSLPELYRQRDLQMRTAIEGYILDNNFEAPTTMMLPWTVTDELHVSWNTWEFNRRVVDRVPNLGVSRLVSSTKATRNAHLQRRGIALMMEGDTYNSKDGAELFQLNVRGIAQCVQETQNFDTIFELITCKEYEQMARERTGTAAVSRMSIEDQEVAEYAVVAHSVSDFDVLIEQRLELMRLRNVVPDLLVGTPGMALHITMVDPVKTMYFTAGPNGVEVQRQGPEALTQFHGLLVYQSRRYETEPDAPRVQPLRRASQIGETYDMRARRGACDSSSPTTSNGFKTRSLDVAIYNENTDRLQRIGYVDALRHSHLYDANTGEYNPVLVQLVDEYNNPSSKYHKAQPSREQARRNDGTTAASDPHSLANHGGHRAPSGAAPVHFLATSIGDNSRWTMAKYIGQLSLESADSSDMEAGGASIVSGMATKSLADDTAALMSLVDLAKAIESQPYSQAYASDVSVVNGPANTDASGAFVGEFTPAELTGQGATRMVEWKPASHGSLVIPRRAGASWEQSVEYPIGTANGPGLRAVAALAPDSGWSPRMIDTARAGVDVLDRLVKRLQTATPMTEAIASLNRAQWFHRSDPIAALFEAAVGAPRDPLWLGFVGRQSNAAGGAAQGNRYNEPLRYAALPLFEPNVDMSSADSVTNALGSGNLNVPSAGDNSANIVWVMPGATTGARVAYSKSALASVGYMSDEYTVMAMMGTRSLPAAIAVYGALTADRRAKLTQTLLAIASSRALGESMSRKLVLALDVQRAGQKSDFLAAVDSVSFVDNQRPSVKVATDAARALTENVDATGDNDYVREPGAYPRAPTVGKRPASLPATGARLNALLTALGKLEDERRLAFEAAGYAYPAANAATYIIGVDDNRTYWDYNPGNAFANRPAHAAALQAAKDAASDAGKPDGPAPQPSSGGGGAPNTTDAVTFYRSPLTMSLALLESMASEPQPLMRVSDPSSGHQTMYTRRADDASLELPEELYLRPQYATIEKLMLNDDQRRLDDLPWVRSQRPNVEFGSSRSKTIDGKRRRGGRKQKHQHKRRQQGALAGYVSGGSDSDVSSSSGDESMDTRSAAAFSRERREFGSRTLGAALPSHEDSEYATPQSRGSLMDTADRSFDRRGAPFDHGGASSADDFHCDVFAFRYKETGKINSPLVRAATVAYLMTPINRLDAVMRAAQADVLLPINLKLWRVSIEHEMETYIMMKGGLSTGANLYGHGNLSSAAEAMSKFTYYNLTFQSKSVVWQTKHVEPLMDIKPVVYNGGSNCKFVRSYQDMARLQSNEAYAHAIDRPSIVVTALPITETHFPKTESLNGFVPYRAGNPAIEGPETPTYSQYEPYGVIYRFDELFASPKPLDNDDFFERAERMNHVARTGLTVLRDPVSCKWESVVNCGGHRRNNGSIPGAAAVWNGQAKMFPAYDQKQVLTGIEE